MPRMYMFHSSYLIILPFLFFTLYAQNKVKSAFKNYMKIGNKKGITGYEVAKTILERNGLRDVKIQQSRRGSMSDHYNPMKKTVNLSPSVYSGRSITALSVAAHEVGHALQHAKGYKPLSIRSLIAPVASFASRSVYFIIILGVILSIQPLITLGIVVFASVVLFQIVTLPVEFNASSRALAQLKGNGLVYNQKELDQSKKVLNAAALTYVAATAMAIAQLLRLVLLSNRD